MRDLFFSGLRFVLAVVVLGGGVSSSFAAVDGGGASHATSVKKEKTRAAGPKEVLGEKDVLRGQFLEEHFVPKLNKSVQTEGRFVFSPQRGVLWQIVKPMPITVVITARGVEQSVAGVPLVRMTPAQMPFLEQAPRFLLAAMRGDWAALKGEFEVSSSAKGGGWRAVLVPRKTSDVRALFSSLTLSGARFVQEAEVVRKNGYKDRFVFSELSRTSAPLAEDEALLFDQVESSSVQGGGIY